VAFAVLLRPRVALRAQVHSELADLGEALTAAAHGWRLTGTLPRTPEQPATEAASAAASAADVPKVGVERLRVVYAGELAEDVARKLVADAKLVAAVKGEKAEEEKLAVELVPAAKWRDELLKLLKAFSSHESPPDCAQWGAPVVVALVVQTVEHGSISESGASLVRLLKRKDLPEGLLRGKLSYAVLGLGDSNLLLDRQTTAAKDCNQAAQYLDGRLAELGAARLGSSSLGSDSSSRGRGGGKGGGLYGEADERTGLSSAVEPWCAQLKAAIAPPGPATGHHAATSEKATPEATPKAATSEAKPKAAPEMGKAAEAEAPQRPSAPSDGKPSADAGARVSDPSSPGDSWPVFGGDSPAPETVMAVAIALGLAVGGGWWALRLLRGTRGRD